MKTKTEQVKEFFAAGQIIDGLRIAKTFRMGLTKSEQAQIVRGYECLIRPDFYRSLKKDPLVESAAAVTMVNQKVLRLA